ncbi:hypothetical protein [Catenuloplanes indicus]|uniref:Uncharacterized protein n=1 Tax=Catenuloplanes indicus TaxID=137267 RepID=A0AAE4AYU0_9ACTN|nr:hypothetical protein [Catenuloplanes indicus]MDQ0365343.1 hypothetical protein [Catenuloplanes indicus]
MTFTIVLVLGTTGTLLLIASAVLHKRPDGRREDGRYPGADPVTLRADVLAALDRGADVRAVRLYRERTGAGLLEAHAEVARIRRESGNNYP